MKIKVILEKLIEIDEKKIIRKLERISYSDIEEEDSGDKIKQNWIILLGNIYE